MKIESIKAKTDSLTKILFAVAVLLAALVFLKIGFFVSSSNAMMTVAQAESNKAGADDMKKLRAQTKAAADEIKKKNLFLPVPARQNPVADVIGILGQEALIGEKWYKVGDSVGDAKIVAIEPTKVKVVWDGQVKEFAPIGSSGAGGRGGPPAGPGGRMGGPAASGRTAGTGSRRGAGPGAAGASSAEMDQFRERYMNASPEEKQRLMEEMRQKRGARGQ